MTYSLYSNHNEAMALVGQSLSLFCQKGGNRLQVDNIQKIGIRGFDHTRLHIEQVWVF